MKIVKQSFEPINNSNSHVDNIASAARICYKSEGKALDDETPFVNGLVKGKHNSTIEFSVLHLRITPEENVELSLLLDSNYITVDINIQDQDGSYWCTGSIRSWREFIFKNKDNLSSDMVLRISNYLVYNIETVFTDDLPEGIESGDWVYEFDPKTLPTAIAKRHIHQGIKFITNRAVTHEFVRHRPVSFLQESQRYCMYSKEQFGKEVTFIEPSAFFEPDPKMQGNYEIWAISCESAEDDYLKLLTNGASPQAARTVLPNSCKTELIIYCSLVQWEHIFAMRDNTHCDPSMQEAIGPVADWFTLGPHAEYFIPTEGWKRSVG